ncbi:MAG TPA: class II glutamine amidotransferase [Alphaproteobacteria bacterium]|jgi:glutamine amidotransferase|nr:class II glutamine amidotransferase [Alphaproteobacteria bacterium]
MPLDQAAEEAQSRTPMCELFALSARFPATVTLSLQEFALHGGFSACHADGWGIAYFDETGYDTYLVRDTAPAFKSPWVSFVESAGLASTTVISHIRKATMGSVSLPNTHPFQREMNGYSHVFAHNGKLSGLAEAYTLDKLGFQPVGTTDSELAFCVLLQALQKIGSKSKTRPPLADRLSVFVDFAAEMRQRGMANFLYADGEALFVHSHKRTQNDGAVRAPGLHMLTRECRTKDSAFNHAGVEMVHHGDQPIQRAALFASVPLSSEGWVALPANEVVVACAGVLHQ